MGWKPDAVGTNSESETSSDVSDSSVHEDVSVVSSQLLGRALLEADMAEGLDDDMARGPDYDVAQGHFEVIWDAVSLGSGHFVADWHFEVIWDAVLLGSAHLLRLWRFVFRSLALDFLALGFNNFIKARCCRNSNSSCLK